MDHSHHKHISRFLSTEAVENKLITLNNQEDGCVIVLFVRLILPFHQCFLCLCWLKG
jgi:hypothetical protein